MTEKNLATMPQQASADLMPRNFDQLWQFADGLAQSGMVPKDYVGKPGAIVAAVQMGYELGLAPMQSLQNISVINGRPSVWGDTQLALCKRHPRCQDVKEYFEGKGDTLTAVCEVHRKGSTPVVQRFSVQQAKKAGLWNKQGPWTQYPERMLQMRARSWALRDAFPDALRGLYQAEEAQDIIDVTPAPAPAPAQPREQHPGTPQSRDDAAWTLESVKAEMDAFADLGEFQSWWNANKRQIHADLSKAEYGDAVAHGTATAERCKALDKTAERVASEGLPAADFDGLLQTIGDAQNAEELQGFLDGLPPETVEAMTPEQRTEYLTKVRELTNLFGAQTDLPMDGE